MKRHHIGIANNLISPKSYDKSTTNDLFSCLIFIYASTATKFTLHSSQSKSKNELTNQTYMLQKNSHEFGSYAELKLDLLNKLSVAQDQRINGSKGRTLKQVITNIRENINAEK